MKPTTILRAAIKTVHDAAWARSQLVEGNYPVKEYDSIYDEFRKRQGQADKFLNKLKLILKDVEA